MSRVFTSIYVRQPLSARRCVRLNSSLFTYPVQYASWLRRAAVWVKVGTANRLLNAQISCVRVYDLNPNRVCLVHPGARTLPGEHGFRRIQSCEIDDVFRENSPWKSSNCRFLLFHHLWLASCLFAEFCLIFRSSLWKARPSLFSWSCHHFLHCFVIIHLSLFIMTHYISSLL